MARDTRIGGSSEPERVYAPSDGTLAYRTDYAYRTAQLAAQPAARPEHHTRPETQQRPRRRHISLIGIARQNKFLPKLLAVCCIAAVAAFAVLTVVRFANIANIQSDINELNGRIAAAEQDINDLDFSSQPNINVTEFARSVGLVPAQP